MNALTRRILTNAALTVFSLVVAYMFCEAVVRLMYKDEAILFPRYHTDYQYGRYTIRGVRPNSEYSMTSIDGSWKFVTNSRGLRNTEDFSYAKPGDTIRVLSLGDSQAQGYEARQDFTFSAILGRVLNKHGKRAEVLNSGVSGFSTAEELVFLENEGIKYNPDVVVLAFFANDFEDNLKAGLFGLGEANNLIEKGYSHIPGVEIQNLIYSIPVVPWLSENSYFYSLLFNNVWNHFKVKAAQEAQYAMPTDAAVSGNAISLKANATHADHAVPGTAAPAGYQIALTAALLERMQRFCSDRGIRFIVVDIPSMPERYHFKSSMPPELREKLAAARVEYIGSEFLQAFDGVAEMHVPHGHHHISEFAHTLIGVEIGRHLLEPVTVKGSEMAKRRRPMHAKVAFTSPADR